MKVVIALLLLSASPMICSRSGDRVVAFSEDGRSMLIERRGAISGGGDTRSFLVISLEGASREINGSRVAASGHAATQMIEPRGPLIVRLVGDIEGNVVVAAPIAAGDPT